MSNLFTLDNFVQIISLVSFYTSYKGSKLFVESNFELGSKLFMIGNVVTMAIGLYVGNLYVFAGQAALCYYTLNMISINTTRFYILMFSILFGLIGILGINPDIKFVYHDVIDLFGSITAIYGSYAMSKKNYSMMAKMWIVADICAIVVAIKLGLIGLLLKAAIFCYHGYLRLKGDK